jgi:hypothetical protein
MTGVPGGRGQLSLAGAEFVSGKLQRKDGFSGAHDLARSHQHKVNRSIQKRRPLDSHFQPDAHANFVLGGD